MIDTVYRRAPVLFRRRDRFVKRLKILRHPLVQFRNASNIDHSGFCKAAQRFVKTPLCRSARDSKPTATSPGRQTA